MWLQILAAVGPILAVVGFALAQLKAARTGGEAMGVLRTRVATLEGACEEQTDLRISMASVQTTMTMLVDEVRMLRERDLRRD